MEGIPAKSSRISVLLIFLSLVLMLGACGSKGVSDVRVEKVEAVRTIVGAEEFPLPNCEGTSELEMSMSTQTAVKKSVIIGARATKSGGEEIGIPEAVKLKLETEIELAYQETYENARSRLDTITMRAERGTHVVYMIEWEEQRFDSIVSYATGGGVYKAPYKYVLCVPKLVDSREVVCPTRSATLTPTPQPPTSTPTLTPQPSTSTPTPQPPTSTPTLTPQPLTLTPTPTPQPPTSMPTLTPQPSTSTPSYVIEFEVDKTVVNPGEWITLRWHVENVQALYLDWKGGAGALGVGQESRQMWETTDHTLRVILQTGETVTRTITITVK